MFLEHISHYEFAKAHLSRNFFTPVVRVFSARTKGISSSCAASVANGTVSLHHFALFFSSHYLQGRLLRPRGSRKLLTMERGPKTGHNSTSQVLGI